MRLHSLYLQDCRVLNEFNLEFDHPYEQNTSLERLSNNSYALDLVVGVNGTGKSTLLRAIAEIFRRLEDKSDVPFGFEITYQVREDAPKIFISNLEETSDLNEKRKRLPLQEKPEVRFRLKTGDQDVDNVSEIGSNQLPPLVVAFTTGSEREWELQHEQKNELQEETPVSLSFPDPNDPAFRDELASWFLQELPGEPVEEQQEEHLPLDSEHFLFIKEKYLPLVILCGLLVDIADTRVDALDNSINTSQLLVSRLQKVLEASNLKTLHGFSLQFRMNKDVLDPRDYDFIQDLDRLAHHHTVQTGSDYLIVFDLDTVNLQELLKDGGLELFRTLARLSEPQDGNPPILREYNLFLERDYTNKKIGNQQGIDAQKEQLPLPLHILDWFSDGERSFLGRLCLLSLLSSSKKEALILLDEPEVHFNDYWKRQLVSMIDAALGQQDSHVLMTTHSSITLSDVLDRDVWVLQRSKDYTREALPPPLRTLGTDPSDIMVYVFGAENAIGAQGAALIERKLEEISQFGPDIEPMIKQKKKDALQELLEQVGPSDLRFLIRRELHALGE
jgi:energy-coupling factor transporter ATP-binding protein EcfA2